ncbi:hypothetical protein MJO29_016474 [Puccinia striiformis f. sp. tritici]|nr:hypothetical protein MJO29_016474 [Puccinia striiformis f. sp. tritici]
MDLDGALVVNKDAVAVVDEDLDKEALDLGLEDNKLIEDLDLGIENHKMIDKCLNLLQSQFGEEDEGDKESEETKERIKEITEKIALENLDEGNKIDKSEKEGDNNDAEKGDGNEDYHLREFPAPPPEKHWKFTVKEPRHNHAPSESPAAHTANRKLSARLFKDMNHLSDAGLKPARILHALKILHPDEMILATITTIYLARKKAFADSL